MEVIYSDKNLIISSIPPATSQRLGSYVAHGDGSSRRGG